MNVQVIRNMYRKFNGYIRKLNGKAGLHLQIRYGIGVVWNFVRYKATISDYFELGFYKKNSLEKKEYLTSKQALYFAEYIDSPKLLAKFHSKSAMYQQLNSFVKREQLFSSVCTYHEFESFMNKHKRVLYKPDKSDCGVGIEVWDNKQSMNVLWNNFIQAPAVLDEMIEQHHELKLINPNSVNTIRVFSLRIKEECILIGAALRMGNGSQVVDNYSAGGLVGSIDIETGVVIDDAEDMVGCRYETHPISGVKIKGFIVPHWDKAVSFVKECAKECELNYVAWDIAIREQDCILIEANPNGMVNVIQIAGAKGRKQQFEDLKTVYQRKGNEK